MYPEWFNLLSQGIRHQWPAITELYKTSQGLFSGVGHVAVLVFSSGIFPDQLKVPHRNFGKDWNGLLRFSYCLTTFLHTEVKWRDDFWYIHSILLLCCFFMKGSERIGKITSDENLADSVHSQHFAGKSLCQKCIEVMHKILFYYY